jgi:hypothetical protein
MYLTQSTIADDPYMKLRVASCAAQQGAADASIDPDQWTQEWRRVWSASPGWDAAWESALANPDKPAGYQPGMDPACITDGQILAQVQTMMPFRHVYDAAYQPPVPEEPAS